MLTNEAIGPVTNNRNVGILHPDQFQESADRGRTDTAARITQGVTWLPGLLNDNNVEMKNGDEFTATGDRAIYLRDTYGIGYAPADRAVLEIVS